MRDPYPIALFAFVAAVVAAVVIHDLRYLRRQAPVRVSWFAATLDEIHGLPETPEREMA